jgi:hypothetical protein
MECSVKIADNSYVEIDYRLTLESGEEIDRSPEGSPLGFVAGTGSIIPGLESALMGRAAGEDFKVTVEPEQAYGSVQDELIQIIPRERFPVGLEIRPGMAFQARGPRHRRPQPSDGREATALRRQGGGCPGAPSRRAAQRAGRLRLRPPGAERLRLRRRVRRFRGLRLGLGRLRLRLIESSRGRVKNNGPVFPGTPGGGAVTYIPVMASEARQSHTVPLGSAADRLVATPLAKISAVS